METNAKNIVNGTIMFVNREDRTATVNVYHMVPAVLTQNMMIGSSKEQQVAFSKLQPDQEIEVIIVSIPDLANANGMIIVRQYDSEAEARNASRDAALAKLTDGVIVKGQVTEVNRGGASISVEGVKIYVPVGEINGQQGKLRSIRPGETLAVQITGRKQDPRRGLSIYASQRLASEAARKQKRQDSIVTLQHGVDNHITFKRPVKSVTTFGAFVHLMNGIDGLLGLAQMDQPTRRLFAQKRLVAGAEISFEIESMQQNGEDWRLRLTQVPNAQALEAARKQKREAAIASLLQASAAHLTFTRPIKAVAKFGAFMHLTNGIDGLLGPAQMDKPTRRLFENNKLAAGAEIVVEIESMFQEGENWRLRLNQKLVAVRKLHGQISSEETACEGLVFKLGQPVATTPQKQEVYIEINGVFGVLNNSEISAADWTGHFCRVGAKVRVYSAAIDMRQGQLQLKAAKR
jgi:ribosomal protein S1